MAYHTCRYSTGKGVIPVGVRTRLLAPGRAAKRGTSEVSDEICSPRPDASPHTSLVELARQEGGFHEGQRNGLFV